MKKRIVIKRRARVLAMSLALGAGMTILGGTTVALAADNNQEDASRFAEKMKGWQEKMSETFRDTWKGLWHDKDAKSLSESSIATASVDLREQPNSYTVRLNLPDRNLDKVEVTWTGDTLHIVAPAEGKAGRYEQDIRLDAVPADAEPTIERKQKDNLVVVTVPKSPAVAERRPLLTPAPWIVPLDAWDRDVLGHMERMRREMDRIFDQTFAEFRSVPEFTEFFSQSRFGSSLDLQEQSDKYVIRAYLPERDMNNVNITVEGQTLKLEAKAENTEQKKAGTVFSRKTGYSQLLTLPGPVQADKMAVERKENMLVVTLPKASSS